MKNIGFTMVKNEEDIIEQFIRHNLNYLDQIYVFDHGSSDNTAEILNRLVSEGLPVARIFDHGGTFSLGYAQAEIMSALLKFAMQQNGAAVYFPMDADEFIHARGSVEEFKATVAAIPDNTCINISGLDIAFVADSGPEVFANAPKSFSLMRGWQSRRGNGGNYKAAIKIADPHLFDQLAVGQGNHFFLLKGSGIAKDQVAGEAIRYIHVPVRSPQQAFRKFVCGWLSSVQKFGKDTPYANHWKAAFDKICAGSGTEDAQLAYMLNNVYIGELGANQDFEAVDATSIFKYELKYESLRTNGLGVTLRSIENDFHAMFLKLRQ